MTKKTYDIRNIEELHRLRADLYEDRKHLTPEEWLKKSNEDGRAFREKLQAMNRSAATA